MNQDLKDDKELINRVEKIDKKLDKLRKYIFWLQVSSVIKIVLIMIPIVLGFIYLPSVIREVHPLIKEILNFMQEITP